MNRFEYGNAVRDLFDLKSWVYSINDRIIRDHNNYFRPETGKMPKVVRVGNRIMGLQQLLENRLLGVMAFPKDPPAENGFNNRGDHLSMTPTLMKAFLELSRSVVNAENFDENCRTWNDLFQDPSKKPSKMGFGSITVDKSVATRSTGLTLSAWIRPDPKRPKSGRQLFVVRIRGGASCWRLVGPMGPGGFGWVRASKVAMWNSALQ